MAQYRIEGTDTLKWVLNGGDGAYMIGEFDGHTFTPDPIDSDRPDPYATVMKRCENYSNKYNGVYIDQSKVDFSERWRWYTAYALQHFNNAPNDRHVRIGWFLVNYEEVDMPFNQAMTFAQELTLKQTPMGLRICAQPVKEIADYYTDCRTAEGGNPSITMPTGPAFDVSVECEASAVVQLAGYTMRYSSAEKRIHITQADGHTFCVPFVDDKGTVKIRALFDVMMCEMYFGDGEVYFPHPSMEKLDGIKVSINGRGSIRVASVGKTMGL
jgi:sucrose-6-phosphate hydrolase SacC (GH32 family)